MLRPKLWPFLCFHPHLIRNSNSRRKVVKHSPVHSQGSYFSLFAKGLKVLWNENLQT